MAPIRNSDQIIGDELENLFVSSVTAAGAANPTAVGTFHVFRDIAAPGPNGLISGAPTSQDALISPGKYLHLLIDVVNANGGSLTVSIFGIDPITGNTYLILASAALVANGLVVIKVGPSLTAAANAVANDFIPFKYAIQIAVATNPVTFALVGMFMP